MNVRASRSSPPPRLSVADAPAKAAASCSYTTSIGYYRGPKTWKELRWR
ncbi:hypothetical protein ACWGDX_34910 [Streptomyces sp. NPDC055025]